MAKTTNEQTKELIVINTISLSNPDYFKKYDLYVLFHLQGSKKKTKTLPKKTDNPEWNDEIKFEITLSDQQKSEQIEVELKDKELIGPDKVIGKGFININEPGSRKFQVELTNSEGLIIDANLNMNIMHSSPKLLSKNQNKNSKTDLTDLQISELSHNIPTEFLTTTELIKIRSAQIQDFKIRVKILQARQLDGNNINPKCTINCAAQRKSTASIKSTNCPFWDEVFFFNFISSESKLFSESIRFDVQNVARFGWTELIGSFKLDIGFVYDMPTHDIVNKWLLLSDLEDASSGPKGYLKVSVNVLSSGDEASLSGENDNQDESQDIETNLLKPPGISLRPATFTIKVYQAEDLPRMDSSVLEGVKDFLGKIEEKFITAKSKIKKDLVDPYVLFSFAGNSIQTRVCQNNACPAWNQQLKVNFKFPSLCDRLRVSLKDWDRLSEDDFIATHDLPITIISDLQPDGFLPTFGPCFLTLYGSPREYREIANCLEELDSGRGEGVAYRGRVLIEIKTNLNEKECQLVTDIKNSEVQRLGPKLRKNKFKLFGVFYDATMLPELDSPVQFEVSIGNYGNTIDESNTLIANNSATLPCRQVFDGCSFYYLPWTFEKQCLQVASYWEDITFRYEALNQIRNLKLFIVESITDIRKKIQVIDDCVNMSEMGEIATSILGIIEEIRYKSALPLPDPFIFDETNELDRKQYMLRKKKLKEVEIRCQKLPKMELRDIFDELEQILEILEKIEKEPQNSIPDVIIWMLCDGNRTAYFRIPAYEIFYSRNSEYRGESCNVLQTVTLKWPGRLNEIHASRRKIPSQIRVKFWFGVEKDEHMWHQSHSDESKDGSLLIYAETFENQAFQWTTQKWNYDGLGRPKFSDLYGKLALPKEGFKLPVGWKWANENEWEIVPLTGALDTEDTSSTHGGKFMEEVYEQDFRFIPGSAWHDGHSDKKPFKWADYKLDKKFDSQIDVSLPENWQWEDEWSIDLHRSVDSEGWEYCVESSMGGWMPVEKIYHLNRRRRWIRTMREITLRKPQNINNSSDENSRTEGWEYSKLFSTKFHEKEQSSDGVRRRRWRRRMEPNENLSGDCFVVSENKETDSVVKYQPRLVVKHKKKNRYQLRAYIYQARGLMSHDTSTSASDPYCLISFMNRSMKTEIQFKTLSPVWDQTLIFEAVEICGDHEDIVKNPPVVNIELYDHDEIGEPDFMGRIFTNAIFKDYPSSLETPSKLEWFTIFAKDCSPVGELLAFFELYENNTTSNLPPYPLKDGSLYRLPVEIRPKLQRTIIEVLVWGVRNMEKFQLTDVSCPQIQVECGSQQIETEIIRNVKKNPNFNKPLIYFDTMIPSEEKYAPPLSFKIVDHRNFGRKPIVGRHVIKTLAKYRVNRENEKLFFSSIDTTNMRTQATTISLDSDDENVDENCVNSKKGYKIIFSRNNKNRKSKFRSVSQAFGNKVSEQQLVEDDIDWWSKFYASLGDTKKCGSYLQKGYDKLVVYNQELENVKQFEGLTDFCQTFKIFRGKNSSATVESERANKYVGELKASLKMYTVLENQLNVGENLIFRNVLPMNNEVCLLRVYLIRGIDLQGKDSNGKSDAYVQIECGKLNVNNRKNYIANSNNPEFGCMFEFEVTLPLDKDMCIKIKDYDLITSDEVIGETWIDIENRVLTKYRASCGLPQNYNDSGINAWRDSRKPSQILYDLCRLRGINCILPKQDENVLQIENKIFTLDQYEQSDSKKISSNIHLGPGHERLCLHVLKEFDLIPEHIETRKLYNPIQPGLEQGKIQMWLDIFPKSLGPPNSAFDIRPRRSKKHFLRCIVWNTSEVTCDDVNFAGEAMSDIYLKGWLQGLENDQQSTDIHYRSMDGDGNFNWRFVFEFDYLLAEQSVVVKRKEHFWSLDETTAKQPPLLTLQIWDNDKFTADDFIGQLSLDLNKMIKPAKTCDLCGLHQLPNIDEEKKSGKAGKDLFISLFKQKRLKGWWPCIMELPDNKREIAGKVELEFEILTEEEALVKPAGRGREEPNQNPRLEPPNRPETSFVWFMSPFKSFKHILWKRYKWAIITSTVITILIFYVLIMLYTLPTAMWGIIF